MLSKITFYLLGFFTLIQFAHALPIDWNGQFGFDTNLIQDVRRTTDDCTTGDGYCVGNDEDNARYQSFIFKLNPTIVVNDSASIKAEISTGNIRGGFMGEDTEGRASYYAQSPSGEQALSLNQMYAELYADTALFKVGKFAKNFGLGALINDGDQIWDRYFSVYNGLEARFNLGKFSVAPIFAKIQSPNPTNAPVASDSHTGKYDTSETGIAASYNDPNKNFEFSVYYSVREVETQSDLYGANKGPSEVTLIDIYFSKAWDKFSIAMEIPMLTGEVGTIYGTNQKEDLDTNAYILETAYQINNKWNIGLNGGIVKGEDGQDEFNALFLHPNYKIAELMFAYNYRAFQNGGDIFDASVTNASYAKLFANYKSEAWTWKLAFIMAKANETASDGKAFYNQESNTIVASANGDQDDDLGMEFDVAFDYQWNPNILVTGYLAYWQVGDFYAFTSTGDDLSMSNITATGMKLSMSF